MFQSIIQSMSSRGKTALVVFFDCSVISVTFLLAYALRLDFFSLSQILPFTILEKLMLVLPIQIICFTGMGLYKGIWRYSSSADLIRVIKAVTLAVPLSIFILFLFQKSEGLPRSLFFIQWALLIIGVGGGRFAYRLYRDSLLESKSREVTRTRKTLIIGAGYAAQLLIRDIKGDVRSDIQIVGILDDDQTKKGRVLHGFKVMGAISDVSRYAEDLKVTDVILTIPSASGNEFKTIVSYLENTNLTVRTIPKLGDIISGKVQISKLRKVSPQDLLGRDQVELNNQSMSHMLLGKTVMVTGAGGSIGSELCFQIAKFKPREIICFDISELNLYKLKFKLEQFSDFTDLKFVVGDVRDHVRIEKVFDRRRPEILFHAAAYKHVPMMEENPFEAIKVNVMGTKIVSELASKFKLERFVLVSTDKAVNPTNVMGTTKRIAEMVCQKMQETSNKVFNCSFWKCFR